MSRRTPHADTHASDQAVVVDRIACTGKGICAQLLPDSIRLDDWGYPIIGNAPADARAVRAAIRLCPTGALR
ncbi:ferredoxin [Gordonia sp. DT30]|uniref:ferredoxin n=1 Tax=unclassified Gordonia (in: high G+C Gram-positive bacteria) TaxID=2657482 RepID=UPI003CE8A996